MMEKEKEEENLNYGSTFYSEIYKLDLMELKYERAVLDNIAFLRGLFLCLKVKFTSKLIPLCEVSRGFH